MNFEHYSEAIFCKNVDKGTRLCLGSPLIFNFDFLIGTNHVVEAAALGVIFKVRYQVMNTIKQNIKRGVV